MPARTVLKPVQSSAMVHSSDVAEVLRPFLRTAFCDGPQRLGNR